MAKLTKEEANAINDSISNTNAKFALTTKDNPFNPFTQYEKWLMFDEEKGYCSNSYLARIANLSDSLSIEETNEEIERAINEILKYDFTNNYKLAVNENYVNEKD